MTPWALAGQTAAAPATRMLAAARAAPRSSTQPAATQHGGYIYEFLRFLDVSPDVAYHVQDLLLRPLTIVLILGGAALASYVGSRLIFHSLGAAKNRAAKPRSTMEAERLETVGRTFAQAWRIVVWVVAALLVLSTLGINIAPFAFGATVVGATLGFGAQSLVRDFLSGFLLLIEDQYRIGDTVTAAGMTGIVEDVTLRVTRLRSDDGTIWYVPNGDIRELGNQSRHWSRTPVDIVVPLGSDIRATMDVMAEEASSLSSDPELASKLLDEPRVLGVESADASGITIRAVLRTDPLEGARIARSLRGRIAERLVTGGIVPRVGAAEGADSDGGSSLPPAEGGDEQPAAEGPPAG